MLQYKTIESHTLELLKALTNEPLLSELRLVGGTSLALQFGHRCSVDLDFFGHIEVDDDELISALRRLGEIQILKQSKNIKIFIINDVKVDIVNYAYPWIEDSIIDDGLRLASPKDIAAMKVNAIEGRGTKKDFIDVFELLKHYSLSSLLDFHKQKYPEASDFRALMSLSYFEDADEQPMPKMFTSESWEQIKNTIKNAIYQEQR